MSQNQTDTTATPKARGFPGLTCLKCGEADRLSIELHDLTGETAVRCQECENEYGVDEARQTVEAWTRLLAWIDQAPALDD